MTDTGVGIRSHAGIGASIERPDGVPKVTGQFEFSNDLLPLETEINRLEGTGANPLVQSTD